VLYATFIVPFWFGIIGSFDHLTNIHPHEETILLITRGLCPSLKN
jgi:hypothetical protein